MPFRIRLRNAIAGISRKVPYFRGKGRLGLFLQRSLTNYEDDAESIVPITLRDGSRIRIDVRSHTERSAFWTGEYDQEIISNLSACLGKGSTVFDVGANIGFYAVQFGHRLKALGGTLYCFEPVRSNFERLLQAIALNELGETVRAFDLALGEKAGIVKLCRDSRDHAATGDAAILEGSVPGYETDSARRVRLDDLVEELAITECDLVKVDIEGSEFGFLRGGAEFLGRTQPLIYCELNPFYMDAFGWTFADFVALTDSLGYVRHGVLGNRLIPNPPPPMACENVLLVHRERPMEQVVRRFVVQN
jgi:FkbM family methyltransferase